MLKRTIKSFLVLMLVGSPVFAEDEALSTFQQHGDIDYSTPPLGEEDYLAEQAPIPSTSTGYFGLNVGPNFASIGAESVVDGVSSGSPKKNAISYAGGIYGGYGANFNHLYLAAELSANYNFLNKKFTNAVPDAYGTKIELTVKQPIIVGFDLIPGYLTESRSFLFYGRLGVGLSLMKLGFTDVTVASQPSDKTNKFVFGLRAGAGMEYFMSDNFGVRLEYIYGSYNKFSGTDKVADNGTKYSYRMGSTETHQVNLGLSIHW